MTDYSRDFDPAWRPITGTIGTLDNDTQAKVAAILANTALDATAKRLALSTQFGFTSDQIDILVKG